MKGCWNINRRFLPQKNRILNLGGRAWNKGSSKNIIQANVKIKARIFSEKPKLVLESECSTNCGRSSW